MNDPDRIYAAEQRWLAMDRRQCTRAQLTGQALVCAGAVDPTVAPGRAAPVGSLYLRDDGTQWYKVGLIDTGWRLAPPPPGSVIEAGQAAPPSPALLVREVVEPCRHRSSLVMYVLAVLAVAYGLLTGGCAAPPRQYWVVYDPASRGFVMDTCAGGTLAAELARATYYATPAAAKAALDASDIPRKQVLLFQVVEASP